jgi:putative oxidoreductase
LLKGYALTNDGFGNFKLPVIYIAMMLPLVFMGPGRLSMDALIHRRVEKSSH